MSLEMKTKNFENALYDLLNRSDLPSCVARLVLENALMKVRTIEAEALFKELDKGEQDGEQET